MTFVLFRRPLLQGVLTGLLIVLGIVLLSLYVELIYPSRFLTSALAFMSLAPVSLWQLLLPAVPAPVFFLAYWVAVGALFGWLLNRRGRISTGVTIALMLALAFGHWSAKRRFEKEGAAALKAAVTYLAEQVAPLLGAVGEQYLKEHGSSPAR